jgi:hypothetical protein
MTNNRKFIYSLLIRGSPVQVGKGELDNQPLTQKCRWFFYVLARFVPGFDFLEGKQG